MPRLTSPDPIPVASYMERMRTALFDAVSEADMVDLVKALMERAKKGDMQAARLILSYVVGSPSMEIQNAVVVNAAPTSALPGTAEKLDVMARRAEKGQPLTLPADRKFG